MKNRNYTTLFRRWFGLLMLLALIFICAWLTQKYRYTFDWTRDSRNTLTETSQNVLQQVEDPLLITVLARNAASERHVIKRQVDKYLKFKPNIDFKFLDADKQIVLAKELHLNSPNQMRIDYKGRFEIINRISEAEISNALQRLSRQNKPWIAFLSGHGERDPFDESDHGFSKLKETLETSGVQVQDLNLLQTTVIPDNVSVLVLAAPQSNLLAGEEKLVLDFVDAGGNLLWLTDPQEKGDTQRPLLNLAEELGLSWIAGTIIDANQELRSILGIQHPAIVPVVEYQQHAITASLKNQTLFPFARGIAIETPKGWRAKPLFYSLPGAWAETSSLSGESVVFNSNDGDTKGPLLIAASLSRTIADRQQRVSIIGDSDFASNIYIGNGANLTLIVSVLQWLAHDDQRIALLPYQPPDISVEFSNTEIAILAAWYLLIAPLIVLLLGLFIGIRRRRA